MKNEIEPTAEDAVDGKEQAAPRFSVIIPAFNEEKCLPRLLDSLETAITRYSGNPAQIEIIVGNNVSTDATAGVAAERGCRVVCVEKRRIGAVRNGGAAIARGSIFVFVDADALVHPETFNVVDQVLDSGAIAGVTGVRYDRMDFGLFLAGALAGFVFKVTGFDLGVVFCHGDTFHEIGGYDEELLFKEDVKFLQDLRRLGQQRQQKVIRCTRARSIFSTRKTERYGHWHLLGIVIKARYIRIFRGRAAHKEFIDRIARDYWYDDPR